MSSLSPTKFLGEVLQLVGPYLKPHWEIDHLCYRSSTLEEYERNKIEFSKIGQLLIESPVGGRPIATFELDDPIKTSHGLISLIELPAPKPGRIPDSGYEHIEVVIDCSFEELMKNIPEFVWDCRAINKDINPEIEAKFERFNVKFHHQSLKHIIELEKKISSNSGSF